MARISTYGLDDDINENDLLSGSNFLGTKNNLPGGTPRYATKNFRIRDLSKYFANGGFQDGDFFNLSELNSSINANATNISSNASFAANLASSFGVADANGNITSFSQSFANLVLGVATSEDYATAAQLTSLTATVNSNGASITANANNITSVTASTNTNTSNITTNTGNITSVNTKADANAADITTLTNNLATTNSNVTQSATDITNLTATVATNTTNITSNDADITSVTNSAATNASNITTLTNNLATTNANVTQNATNHTSLTATVTTNTTNIASNDSDITTANTNIASNTSDITTLTNNLATANTAISQNTSNVTSLTGTVNTNTTNIAGKPETFRQTSAPAVSEPVGSLWFDTDDNNKVYILVSGSPNVWTAVPDSRIAANANSISTNTSNITANASDITTLTNSIATTNANVTQNATNVTNLTSTVTANTAAITSNDGDITTANTNIASNASDITTLTNNLATANTAISQNASNHTSLTSTVNTNTTNISAKPSVFRQNNAPSVSSPVGSLWYDTNDTNKLYVLVSGSPNVWTITNDTRIASNANSISTNTSNITTNANNISTLTNDLNTAETNITQNASNVTSLTSTVNTNTTNITNNDTDIATANTNIATNASNITTLTNDLNTAETAITNNASNVTSLTSTVNTNTTNISNNDSDIATANSNISTNATNINTLNTGLTTANNNISANSTNITTLTTDLNTAEGNITSNASSISSLTTTVNGNTTSISTNASSINGVKAKFGVTINANGAITGYRILGDTSGASEFIINANDFKIFDSGGNLNPFSVSGSKVQINGDLNVSSAATIGGTATGNDANGRPTALFLKNLGTVSGNAASVALEMQSASRFHHVINMTGTGGTSSNFDLNAEYRLGKSLVAGNEGDNYSFIVAKMNGGGIILPNQTANSTTPSSDFANGMSIHFNSNDAARTVNSGRLHVSEFFKTFFLDIPANPLTTGTYANRGFSMRKFVSPGGGQADFESEILFVKPSTNSLHVTGDVVAAESSDKRLKDNIKPIANAAEKIKKIGGYEFDWNNKQKLYEGHDVGVIAQEIEEVLPEVVETREDGYKAVNYKKLVPLLIEGIKDLQNQINELKNGDKL